MREVREGFARSYSTAYLKASKKVTITHGLGHIPQVWFLNSGSELSSGSVTSIGVNTFDYEGMANGTIYYR